MNSSIAGNPEQRTARLFTSLTTAHNMRYEEAVNCRSSAEFKKLSPPVKSKLIQMALQALFAHASPYENRSGEWSGIIEAAVYSIAKVCFL